MFGCKIKPCRLAQLAALFVQVAVVHPASAAITVTGSPTLLPGAELVSYELIAHPTAGENIASIGHPTLSFFDGSGVHQVWAPFFDLPTPTLQSHLGYIPVWTPTWSRYDSYFYFKLNNPVIIGGNLTETNTGTGVLLPPDPVFGPPRTGYGTISSSPDFVAFYPGGAGAGVDLPFMQFVMRVHDIWQFDVRLGAHGQVTPTEVSIIPALTTPPIVTHNKLTAAPGMHVSDLFEAVNQFGPGQPLTWQNFNFSGPGIALQPSFGYDTHQFDWDTTGSAPGIYKATVQVRNQSQMVSNATLTITLIPEPSSLVLLAAALFIASGFIRRR
jgi:hypothetical protein